jgi:hypothetical protein
MKGTIVLAVTATVGIVSPGFAHGLQTGTAADTYGWNSPQADAVGGDWMETDRGGRVFAMVPQERIWKQAGARHRRRYRLR